jgi:hypothetical protein
MSTTCTIFFSISLIFHNFCGVLEGMGGVGDAICGRRLYARFLGGANIVIRFVLGFIMSAGLWDAASFAGGIAESSRPKGGEPEPRQTG